MLIDEVDLCVPCIMTLKLRHTTDSTYDGSAQLKEDVERVYTEG